MKMEEDKNDNGYDGVGDEKYIRERREGSGITQAKNRGQGKQDGRGKGEEKRRADGRWVKEYLRCEDR